MRTLVTFQTSRFNTSQEKDYFINPNCFGDDTCQWLMARLRESGVKVEAEPGQEDFGWYFEFGVPEGVHCCVVGWRPGDTDADEGTWIAWLERSRGFVASLFGRSKSGIAPSALIAIHKVLSTAPEIRNVKWHEQKAFDQGREELGSAEP